MPLSIFWADDELHTTGRFLAEAMTTLKGYTIDRALTIKECLEKLDQYFKHSSRPDVVILDVIFSVTPDDVVAAKASGLVTASDLNNARKVGAVLLHAVKKSLPDVPVIFLTNLNESSPIGAVLLPELRKDTAVRAVS